MPVGYDRKDGLLIQNDRCSAVLHTGQLYATGQYSAARIADMLNQVGYLNAAEEPFKVYAVEEMLKNPVYAGFVVLHGEIYTGKHQPIWDTALWSRMQQIQLQRSRRRLRPAIKHDPLLAGLVYCANCGAAMWHFPRDGWRSYRCCVVPSKRAGPIADIICTDTWAHAEAVEDMTLAWISALALTPDLLERALLRYRHAKTASTPNPDGELRKLKQAFLAERLSAAAYEAQKAALLAAIPVRLAPADDSAAIVTLLQNLPKLIENATNSERRTVLQQLISEVYVRQKAVLAFRLGQHGSRSVSSKQLPKHQPGRTF